MKKSKINIVIVLLFFVYSTNPIKPDSRLIDYLGQEKVDILQKNNPDLIRYYNFFLDNAYELANVPADKLADNNFKTLDLKLENGEVDTEELNVLELNIQRKYNEKVYFKIRNSNQIIVFLSEKEFIEKYNKYREKLGLIKQ